MQLVRRGGIKLDLARDLRFYDFGANYVRADSTLKVTPRLPCSTITLAVCTPAQKPLPVTLGAGRFRPHQLLLLLLLLSAAFPGAQSVGASRALIQSTLQDEVMRRNAGKLTVMDGCRVSGLLWDEEKTRVKGECAACLNLLLVLVLVLL
jgi:hypothetical protein